MRDTTAKQDQPATTTPETFTIATASTDDLIRYLGNYRFSSRGGMSRQLRDSINRKMQAIEITLAERGMSAIWIANIS